MHGLLALNLKKFESNCIRIPIAFESSVYILLSLDFFVYVILFLLLYPNAEPAHGHIFIGFKNIFIEIAHTVYLLFLFGMLLSWP